MGCGTQARRAGARGLPAVIVAALVAGCAAPTAEAPARAAAGAAETASVGGYDFVLENGQLRYTGPGGAAGAFALDTPLACHVARGPDGEVRTQETRAGSVALIVCSEVEREIGGRPLCDTLVRGIVVAPDGVTLPDRAQRVGVCPPFAWDEQMFLYFAE